MKPIIASILFLSCYTVSAQQQYLSFQVSFDKQPVILNKKYFLSDINDSIKFDNIKFYVSHVIFYNEHQSIPVEKKHILLDVGKQESLNIPIPEGATSCNKIKFTFGVDSTTAHSGVFGGDLDPTNGMYWAWQSGYINIKIEGSSPACPARKNKFQYHIGGFLEPYNTVQHVELNTTPNKDNIIINLPLDKLLKSVDIRTKYQVMSPNKNAVDIAQQIAGLFQVLN